MCTVRACLSCLLSIGSLLQVGQLDDRMVFFIASLPNESYVLAASLFEQFSNGTLKDQHVPRSKKGVKGSPDLKASVFKFLRGLETDIVCLI